MHPISTDTTAIRTALWDLTAQIPEHSGTYRPKGKVGKELVCFLCAFPPSLTMEIYCTVGCSFIFALCLLFPWFLPALLSVSISTLFQGVHFQNCFCAFFSGHQSTTVSPFSPPSFPFSLPSCLSWDRSSGLVAICCLFFFFYEVEIRWHLIDRHGLHGYQGDRALGRDTFSSLGLSDHSWEGERK